MATFLHTLDEGGWARVLLHLSSRPASPNWVASVASQDAMSAMHPDSALSAVARREFTRLSISAWREEEGHESFDILMQWLAVAEKSLKSLHMDHLLEIPDSMDFLSLRASLLDKFVSLRKLNIMPIANTQLAFSLLFATKGCLLELSADGLLGSQIAIHGKGLKTLVLCGEPNSLHSILTTVGPTLRSIEFVGYWQPSEREMESLQTFCRQLRRILLFPHDQRSYTRLLVSYGAQLEFASFEFLSQNLCRQVVDACPLVRCVLLDLHSRFLELAKMQVLGASLTTLCFRFDDPFNEQDLVTATRKCTRVERITLWTWAAFATQAIRGLLLDEKPLLKAFHLEVMDHEPADALWELGIRSKMLREFSFAGGLQGFLSAWLL